MGVNAHHGSGDRSKREYIRHPVDVPIHIDAKCSQGAVGVRLNNVSVGGLSFRTPRYIAQGVTIRITIDIVEPRFEVDAIVLWCHCIDEEFEIGVEFADAEDAFRMRMVEQVCHIEHYRQQVWREEKRLLNGETAAAEWIERYAHEFPSIGSPSE